MASSIYSLHGFNGFNVTYCVVVGWSNISNIQLTAAYTWLADWSLGDSAVWMSSHDSSQLKEYKQFTTIQQKVYTKTSDVFRLKLNSFV